VAITETNDKSILSFQKHAYNIDKLLALGFSQGSEEKVDATKVAPGSIKVCFTGPAMRSVDLVFYPLPLEQGIILVYINNLGNGQVINLKDWLKKHDQLTDPNSFKLSSYGGKPDQRWSQFLNFLNTAFSISSLKEILRGNAWEDIPFDWAGIK
jgi:hypothetical protein